MSAQTTNPLEYNTARGGGVYGPSVALDPVFEYYHKRPLAETLSAIRKRGFTAVQVIDTGARNVTGADYRRVTDACREAGLVPVLRIHPGTDWEAYETHPEWRQRMLGRDDSRHDWRVYLCPNKPEFLAAHAARVQRLLREGGFEHFQMAEPWFEIWGGPEEDGKPRAGYACLCDVCRAKFREIGNVDAYDMLTSPGSPAYWRNPENAELYRKWVDFRVDSVTSFALTLARAAREVNPQGTVNLMYLSDARVELDRVREYQGVDLERLVKEIRPELVSIQDAWQDWMKADLRPDFVADYGRAYADRIRKVQPGAFIASHADIGSVSASKRSYRWIQEFAHETLKCGFDAPSFYEWAVSTMAE